MKKEDAKFREPASLNPSTKGVRAVRCQFNDKEYNSNGIVIVDTPSFHTYLDDAEGVLKEWVDEK